MRAGILLADGVEEVEAITVIDVLRRAQIEVITISIKDTKKIHGAHDVYIGADAKFEDVQFGGMNMIILPGGGKGTENLKNDDRVIAKVKEFYETGKYVAAICAAPTVLAKAGILDGKKATCYPGCEAEFDAKVKHTGQRVVTDGKIITGLAPGAAMEFALKLVEELCGIGIQSQVKKEMCA